MSDLGMLQSPDDATRLIGRRQIEQRVHRDHDEIQLLQDLVLLIESAIGENIDLLTAQDPDLGMARLDLLDLLPLLPNPVCVQTPRHGQGLAVVCQSEILVSLGRTSHQHFLDRVLAVRPGGVHLQIAANLVQLYELRQSLAGRSFDLTAIFSQLRRNPGQLDLLVDIGLVPSRHHLSGPGISFVVTVHLFGLDEDPILR